MFGQTKSDSDKKLASLTEEISDLKNQRKLAELDFEKRILLLEDGVNTINKTVGSAKNLKDMKENLEHITDVQEKMREIEDRQLIDRLETMQSQDTLNALDDTVQTMTKKLDLLSDAIKILGGRTKEGHAVAVKEKLDTGYKDAEVLKAEIAALRAEKADAGALQALGAKFASFEGSIRELDKNFAELATSARESLKKRDSDMALVQKKIADFEMVSVKTEKLAAGVDALMTADKKMEALLSSLRNQITAAESRIAPIDSLNKADKQLSLEMKELRSEIESSKKGVEAALKKNNEEFSKTLESSKAAASDEVRRIHDVYISIEKEYGKVRQALDEMNSTLEKRVAKSTEDVLKRETRLHEESLAALKSANKKTIELGSELEATASKISAKYAKLCTMLGERDVSEFIRRVEEIRATEDRIKRDVHSALAAKAKDIVDEELKDVTANLKKISEIAYRKEIKPEDIEHIVENKLTTVAADYNKLGKALGTTQRVMKEEHVDFAKSVHKKIEDDIQPVKDEIADLREDIEMLKNLRGDLVDDINRIIAGYEDKNKVREVQKLENAEEFEAEKVDRLEEAFNKKLAELMHRMDEQLGKASGDMSSSNEAIEEKISVLERENQILRSELEELKEAYFQITKFHQNAPVIIE